MKALLFFANGFEEIEAIGVLDILRRAGIEICTVSITDDLTVEGAHGQKIITDATLAEVSDRLVDAVILPGGMPGAANLRDSEGVQKILAKHDREGKLIAAICAAPMALAKGGLLEGIEATCYPGFEAELSGAKCCPQDVVRSGHIITGRGPGYVFDFALAIVESLVGKEMAHEVAKGMLLTEKYPHEIHYK